MNRTKMNESNAAGLSFPELAEEHLPEIVDIYNYYVLNSTGRRIGESALHFIEKKAAELEFHTLVATVCSENERSSRLFLRNGYEQSAYFKEIGTKFGRRLDIVSFQKIIGDQA